MNEIEVKYYRKGGHTYIAVYDSVEIAFRELRWTKLEALAYRRGTQYGGYAWDPGRKHEIEAFALKLSVCSDSAADYSARMTAAGICRAPYPGLVQQPKKRKAVM